MLARTAASASERDEALREGAALLEQPCQVQALLGFYVNAIEACIATEQWDAVLRYAKTLEAAINGEAFPWAALLIDRARALAEYVTGARRNSSIRRLRVVRRELQQAGLGGSLEAIDHALDSIGASRGRLLLRARGSGAIRST